MTGMPADEQNTCLLSEKSLYTLQPIKIHAQPLFIHVRFELHLDKHGSRYHLTLLHDPLTKSGVADLDPSLER